MIVTIIIIITIIFMSISDLIINANLHCDSHQSFTNIR